MNPAPADGPVADSAQPVARQRRVRQTDSDGLYPVVVSRQPSLTELHWCAYCGARCYGRTCRGHSDLPRLDYGYGGWPTTAGAEPRQGVPAAGRSSAAMRADAIRLAGALLERAAGARSPGDG